MGQPLSAADALFGKTRQAVLALLFGNPDRAYYVREIVHAAKSGASQVQSELERMTRSELVTRERRANQVYFKANPQAAIYHELVTLVAKSFGIGDALRFVLAPVSTRIHVALIYGSVARGQHRATSDVDVLIVGDVLLSELEGPMIDAEQRLSRHISPTVMDRREFAKRRATNDHFLRSVLAGPKIFLIGGPRELKTDDELRAR